MFKKILSVLAIVLVSTFLLASVVQAQDSSTTIKVDHVAGGLEKVMEKVTLFLKFNKEAKTDYYQYLLEKRLAEISYVIGANNIDMVEPTASRYTTYIGVMADYMIANKVSDKKDQVTAEFGRHRKVLMDLQGKFKHDSGWWLAIQHDINSTNDFTEKLKGI